VTTAHLPGRPADVIAEGRRDRASAVRLVRAYNMPPNPHHPLGAGQSDRRRTVSPRALSHCLQKALKMQPQGPLLEEPLRSEPGRRHHEWGRSACRYCQLYGQRHDRFTANSDVTRQVQLGARSSRIMPGAPNRSASGHRSSGWGVADRLGQCAVELLVRPTINLRQQRLCDYAANRPAVRAWALPRWPARWRGGYAAAG
jgi:hypothetical protein